ncbi:hypothetical protein U1Q18_002466 [Sarracenia purpurea var. burkii]
MESSKVLGCSEESSSSESGWTTYVSSPIREESNYENYDEDDLGTDKKVDDDEEVEKDDDSGESDDSMASDASSGRSHPEVSCGTSKGSRIKQSEREDNQVGENSSGKKDRKLVENNVYERRIKPDKDVTGRNSSIAAGNAHGGTTVRKTTMKMKKK